ncbi:hypothetical protein [Streptomyces fulvorobeus]|uniref:IrrE N-terminal-like domain-containing protein n=1 Tax=Streptomyces fulvorobeus TaxID=284028 RepID=A0A7J0BZX5_9ACTN|nr:hypothetical protein [Streptomyces fulvorobeus]NYE39032.1 hypothetical protein [Streptomyces fulvorobeus]GFM95223.1 hypothetical protein Sfulv_00340 [Streptomyces fulvorobeus]
MEHMSRKYLNLCRRCQVMLHNIDIPHPFSLDVLCRRVEKLRDRPLHLHQLPQEAASAGVCGLWLATSSADHVFYEGQTSRLHQEHIVLHELGHILFGHNALQQGVSDGIEKLLPDLDMGRVQRLLGRTNYTTRQEQEAEMLASLIRMSANRPHEEKPQGALAKLESALGVRASDVR